MSSFEPIQDAAFALKAEGQEIKINDTKGVPATGQATVEWTIPKPAQGCESSDTGAYAGIVILLNTEAMDGTNIPQDGTVYVADPTADPNLSTADKIGGAMVVGAVYECEEKARGETLTTSIVINDIDANTGYYVAGYAVDCQNRYHSDGVRAYSDVFSNKEDGSISASQEVKLGVNQKGVLPTDGTGLLPGVDYEFDIIYDNTFPEATDSKTIPITIDGLNAGTYQDLLEEIRNDILLIDNPTQSPVAPSAGGFYWNAVEEQLYQFDGYTHTAIDSINEDTDPSVVVAGTYWYAPSTDTLKRYNAVAPWIEYNAGSPINYTYVRNEADPTNPACDDIWFNGTIARTWNGTTWIDGTTLVSATDPSDCPTIDCGTIWYDEVNGILNAWDDNNSRWIETSAISWTEAPNALSVGTYWYDDVALKLYELTGSPSTWTDITAASYIQETQPTIPDEGKLWYKPSTEELKKFTAIGSPVGWLDEPVLVWEGDPTVVASGDLWWNTINDNMYLWDAVNSQWDLVVNFVQSAIDPSDAATIAVGTFWYNTNNSTLNQWEGTAWVAVDFMNSTVDPINLADFDVWYKPSTDTWSVRGAGSWTTFDPIDSEDDPTVLPVGTYWFDTATTALNNWNGAAWTNVAFSTIPYTFLRGEQWYNTTDNTLYEWNGTTWTEAVPVVDVAFTTEGHFLFWTRQKGSNTAVLIPTPEGSTAESTPCSYGTGFAFDGVLDVGAAQCEYANIGNVARVYPARAVPTNSFLWGNLQGARVITPKGGNDGISGVPSYLEQGVGTDGTPDERRELMDSIRRQLGYPIVAVELDNVQLDTCVNIALETYRQRAAGAYRRGFFFLDIAPGRQQYLMTNKVIGYNRIVTVTAAYRFTSAFLSSAHGAGAYGQIVLQHLYNMGTYDLTSFFLVSQYVEQLEHLFATRLTFSFHENDRLLSFYTAFTRQERVLLDCMVERSEQDLLKDRYSKIWIERYALAEAMMMLSQIRGKFATLPGAGGGVSLNAAELVTLAQSYREDLLMQLDEYVADIPEELGMHSTFILG